MKHTALANASSRSNSARDGRRRRAAGYAVCIDNRGYEVSLDVGKIYRLLPPTKAVPAHYLRVIDESGEDYLFDEKRFVFLSLPPKATRALSAAGRA